MTFFLVIVASYLIGSIPVSYLVARCWKGIDIRNYGSGNVGTTNVWRNVGPAAGVLAWAGDLGKGVLTILLAKHFGGAEVVVVAAAGIATLVGHSWSVFLGFKGGKMVATFVGVIAAIALPVGLIAAFLWLAVVGLSGYVSVGSIVAVISIPLLIWAFHLEWPYLVLGILVAALVIYKHMPNIKRLASGTEPKIKRKLR
ncbi:MAG: glycerol-3-phosphate 1-O-acyltransferase PlsY [Desulfotomaculaceae bacterium]|nr:glycerol-3-phosphate 1-O-acyltransferase PlsY [Desulfotomaculaceae bacterium]